MPVKSVQVGGAALSRETGLSPATISKHLRSGKTPDQIRRLAAAREAVIRQTGLPRKAINLETGQKKPPPGPPTLRATTVPDLPRSQRSTTAAVEVASSYVPPRAVPSKRTGVIGNSDPVTQALDLPVLPPAPSEYTYEQAVADHQEAEMMAGAQLRRAIALADEKEIQNARARGELVPVEYIRVWGTRFLVQMKETLLKGPGELQDHLAGESNPGACNALIRGWVERVLAEAYNLEGLWDASGKQDTEKTA